MHNHFTGVLVVASYKPEDFNEDDVTLLENIAGKPYSLWTMRTTSGKLRNKRGTIR
jgi:hypothetical protein